MTDRTALIEALERAEGPDRAQAVVLVRADDPDKKPMLYACPKCGSVHSPAIYLATEERKHAAAREAAENCYSCRTHDNCSTCGCETPKGWTKCGGCRLSAKLAAATEVPDDGGPYCEFDGDTYFHDIEEAADAGLEWVSPCHVTYPRIDGEAVLDSLLGDMHEDAEVDDLDGVTELLAAVKVFNDAQKCRSFWGDDKRKINIAAALRARASS